MGRILFSFGNHNYEFWFGFCTIAPPYWGVATDNFHVAIKLE